MTDQQQEAPVEAEEPTEAKTTEDTNEVQQVEEIVFNYAGANAGGQALHMCGKCGSLLQETGIARHVVWHQNGEV